eukprot:18449-Ditylum_brightwellii.AAC.1
MPTQSPRNENENSVKIGNGSGKLNGDNDSCSFIIQDAIEHNLAQSLQEEDDIICFDDNNESSVDPLPRNEHENTINEFLKMMPCHKHHFANMLRQFAAENNMDPYQDGFPHHLPKHSEIEE